MFSFSLPQSDIHRCNLVYIFGLEVTNLAFYRNAIYVFCMFFFLTVLISILIAYLSILSVSFLICHSYLQIVLVLFAKAVVASLRVRKRWRIFCNSKSKKHVYCILPPFCNLFFIKLHLTRSKICSSLSYK